MNMTKVLIVEDSAPTAAFFESVLLESGRYMPVQVLEAAKAALLYCRRHEVNLVLMDVYTANRENGLTAAAELKAALPGVKVIIATSLPEESFLQRAREAGCESFWYKNGRQEELLDVMDRTMEGKHIYPDHTPEVKIGSAISTELTPTELVVLRKICEGKTNREIGNEMFISENTVKTHIKNMLQKTGYTSKYRMVIDAVEQRLIVPDF